MRWIGNKYVDDDGRIVADIDPLRGDWVAHAEDSEFLGRFMEMPDAKRAVERWWDERQGESLRLEEKA